MTAMTHPPASTVRVNGGPYDGAELPLQLPADARPRHLWLSEVDGQWHAYLLVPVPDRDDEHLFSHLGPVAELPVLS